jgi:putative transposase
MWGYCGIMRYSDGGGLSSKGRARREHVRLQAASWFAQGVHPCEVAKRLRVSTNSAYLWRRRWRAGGQTALVSRGAGGARCRLSPAQIERLLCELRRGPAAHGWVDQRWTLARITTLIGRLFHVRYTLRGTSYLLHRIGWSVQVPKHRAVQRDEAAITTWRTATWARVRGSSRTQSTNGPNRCAASRTATSTVAGTTRSPHSTSTASAARPNGRNCAPRR